ncbi:LysM peptidoglycan-binding domain-containing protein [Halobacillus sp. Marseille-Q1614]|uniref:LysM peptidoglycan-binding domain-containing protein n=1 Tax=Halobacillus sp. Marseille-Q1614 TaxID=2709134 RepID=UPI00156D518B|nr:LysM peptidoglycan-binding domain-containing protein [Halobacillus sp. Marseille-Q1614]
MPIVDQTHFMYTVQPGDTLYTIANRFGTNVSLIESANALYPPITDPGLIYPGQLLVLTRPGLHEVYQMVSQGDTLYSYAQRYSASVDLLHGINPQVANPVFIYPNQFLRVPAFIYDIEPGDTLNSLSRRFGLSLAALLNANKYRPGLSPDVIYPGYYLVVPLPSSQNILVTQPFAGTPLIDGQLLSGYARAFEGSILYRIIDSTGQVVTDESPIQTSAGAPMYGRFSTPVRFDRPPSAAEGELWVYTRSANDGSVQDLVQVAVRF